MKDNCAQTLSFRVKSKPASHIFKTQRKNINGGIHIHEYLEIRLLNVFYQPIFISITSQ